MAEVSLSFDAMVEGRIWEVNKMRSTVVLATNKEIEQLVRNKLDDESLFYGTQVIFNDPILLRTDRFLNCIVT